MRKEIKPSPPPGEGKPGRAIALAGRLRAQDILQALSRPSPLRGSEAPSPGGRGVIVLLLLFLLTPQESSACTCAFATSDEEEIAKANSIFTATVHKKMRDGQWLNEFKIHKAWKGFALKSDTAWQSLTPVASCDYFFEDGEDYLIFADAVTKKNVLLVTTCSVTEKLSRAENLLKILGDPVAKHSNVTIGGQIGE